MRQARESSIEQACVKLAKERHAILLKIRGEKGMPDRILLREDGTIAFCEFKQEGKPLQPIQEEMFSRLRFRHFKCYEVDNVQLFKRILANDC